MKQYAVLRDVLEEDPIVAMPLDEPRPVYFGRDKSAIVGSLWFMQKAIGRLEDRTGMRETLFEIGAGQRKLLQSAHVDVDDATAGVEAYGGEPEGVFSQVANFHGFLFGIDGKFYVQDCSYLRVRADEIHIDMQKRTTLQPGSVRTRQGPGILVSRLVDEGVREYHIVRGAERRGYVEREGEALTAAPQGEIDREAVHPMIELNPGDIIFAGFAEPAAQVSAGRASYLEKLKQGHRDESCFGMHFEVTNTVEDSEIIDAYKVQRVFYV